MFCTLGEYNRDLDSASLAYGNSDFYYDYPNKQMAYIVKVDNVTAQTKTTTWSIFKYAQVVFWCSSSNTHMYF